MCTASLVIRAVVERNRPDGRLTEIRVVFIFNLIADTESLLGLVSATRIFDPIGRRPGA